MSPVADEETRAWLEHAHTWRTADPPFLGRFLLRHLCRVAREYAEFSREPVKSWIGYGGDIESVALIGADGLPVKFIIGREAAADAKREMKRLLG